MYCEQPIRRRQVEKVNLSICFTVYAYASLWPYLFSGALQSVNANEHLCHLIGETLAAKVFAAVGLFSQGVSTLINLFLFVLTSGRLPTCIQSL